MRIRLRILHGKLQKKEGGSAGHDVKVRGPRFVIGSAADCSMCCRSRSISRHHCELRVEGQQAIVRDLNSRTGTFVNDQPVEGQRTLQAGDRLRIGRLQFEVLIDQRAAGRQRAAADEKPANQPVAEAVVETLVEADEAERMRRLKDPELRYLHLDKPAAEPAEQQQAAEHEVVAEEEAAEPKGKKKKKPAKKPPKKLPPPPPITGKDSTEAAEESLRRLLGHG